MLSERSPFPSSDKEEQAKPALPGLDCFSDEQSQEQRWLQVWEERERVLNKQQQVTAHRPWEGGCSRLGEKVQKLVMKKDSRQ